MITLTQYTEKYAKEVYDFVYNTMSEELDVNNSILDMITEDLKDIQKNYLDKNGCFWLALNDETDEVIGTIAIVEIKKGISQLKRFYVKKEYRHQKIGYKLYNLAEQYAIVQCFKEIYLVSGKELASAHKFYERNGWKKANHKKGKIDIFVRHHANLFRKKLELNIQNEFYESFVFESNKVYSRVS